VVDVDGVDVSTAGELGEDGRRVADADADDEHQLARLRGDGLEQSGGVGGGEHARAELLGRAVGVREHVVGDERLAGDRPHRARDGVAGDDGFRLVFEAVDHICPQQLRVHSSKSEGDAIEPDARRGRLLPYPGAP